MRARVALLDLKSRDRLSLGDCLDHFIRVMQHVTPFDLPHNPARAQVADAEEVDDVVGECQLLQQIQEVAPSLVDGPMDRNSQYWIGTGKPSYIVAQGVELSEGRFIDVSSSDAGHHDVKPFGVGLFTSTGLFDDAGMWLRYLQMQGDSGPASRPWRVWKLILRPGSRIAEVTTAYDWVSLVCSYPRHKNGYVFPDWQGVAVDFDAVHVSVRAVVGTQGLLLRTNMGPTAPPFWDVETTFWLRWCVAAASGADL